jgi:hypothetical protein
VFGAHVGDEDEHRAVEELRARRQQRGRDEHADRVTGEQIQERPSGLQELRHHDHGPRPEAVGQPPGDRRHGETQQGGGRDDGAGGVDGQVDDARGVQQGEREKETGAVVVDGETGDQRHTRSVKPWPVRSRHRRHLTRG